MVGSMRTFVTDGQTDGAGFIRTRGRVLKRKKKSKNQKNFKIKIENKKNENETSKTSLDP